MIRRLKHLVFNKSGCQRSHVNNFQFQAKGECIPITFTPHIPNEVANKVMQSKKFNDYLLKIQNSEQGVKDTGIQVMGVDLFSGGKVGFISLKASTNKDCHSLPNFVFLRGQSVMVLVFVNGKVAIVEQYRVPAQSVLIEAPAGMLDEDGDFVSKAAQEIEEETGIKINK